MKADAAIQLGSLIIPIISLLVSALSLYISRKAWSQSNRPIVTVRITSAGGGNQGTALNIVVENTGNRPAKNIQLTIDPQVLESLYADNQSVKEEWRRIIGRVFSERGTIPMLGNGKSTSNSFGFLSGGDEQSTWKDETRAELTVSYEDLDGRKFGYKNPILIAGDEGFAAGSWGKAE